MRSRKVEVNIKSIQFKKLTGVAIVANIIFNKNVVQRLLATNMSKISF